MSSKRLKTKEGLHSKKGPPSELFLTRLVTDYISWKNLRKESSSAFASVRKLQEQLSLSLDSTRDPLNNLWAEAPDKFSQCRNALENEESCLKILVDTVMEGIAMKAQEITCVMSNRRQSQRLAATTPQQYGLIMPTSEEEHEEKRHKLNFLSYSLPIMKKKGSMYPALCGSIPSEENYVPEAGDLVAAKISKSRRAEEWILAVFVGNSPDKDKYDVEDVDSTEKISKDSDDHSTTRKRYSLGGKLIIPLPKYLPESFKNAEFVTGDVVLALYPETTCFYKALVVIPPSRNRHGTDYILKFEGDEEVQGTVPQRHVSPIYVIGLSAYLKRSSLDD